MIIWIVALTLWCGLLIWFPKTPYSSSGDLDFLPFFAALRSEFERSNLGISADAQALVSGLSIGDDSRLSEATATAMQTVGISHLTAVSGANCAIVIALVYFVLKRFGLSRAWRSAIASAALIFYVLLVGPEPSVLRSAAMALVVLLAVAAGRTSSAMAALGACVLFLLVIDPALSSSVGFALSASATAGILTLAPKLNSMFAKKLPAWLAVPASVSLAAQVACWPILLFIQEGVSTYSLFANLMVEPLVAPITIIGLLACLLATPLPPLALLLCWIASIFAWPIVFIANFLSDLPATTLLWPGSLTGVVAAVVVVTLVAISVIAKGTNKRRFSLALLLLIGSVFFGTNSADITRSTTWARGDWNIVACNVGQGDALVIRDAGQTALIDVGREPKMVDACLDQLSISQIDLLVLTHYDFDHVGGLTGAIAKRKIGAVLLTAFKDNRPAKQAVDQVLEERSIPVLRASLNQVGTLGRLHWRVINADSPGYQEEDSNDASTALHFSGSEFELLALADTGERAQQRIASRLGTWSNRDSPLVLKVAHHGSADQYPELIESLKPNISLVSVGAKNSYGHPTARTLSLLQRLGSTILRTDQLGSVALDTSVNSNGEVNLDVLASG